jgi:hypothetical protein
MSDSLMDLAKIKIQQDYEAELAEAKANAQRRRDERLISAEKMFGDAVLIRKPHPTGGHHVKNFQNGELEQLVLEEVEKMAVGTRFTLSMLGQQMSAKDPRIVVTSPPQVITRAFRGTQIQRMSDVSVKLRAILIENSIQAGEKMRRYAYERKMS